jgi:hypothetical protein
MKTIGKTNASHALDGALTLRQPANDGNVTLGHQDDVSLMLEDFSEMSRECYEAGYSSGKESGYRQGYGAGFADGRRQGDDGSTAAPAAVENTAPGMRKVRLFGLPCTKCGKWFFCDEARCPRCQTPRVSTRNGFPLRPNRPAVDLQHQHQERTGERVQTNLFSRSS